MIRVESGAFRNIGTRIKDYGQKRVTRKEFIELGVKGVFGIAAGLALGEISLVRNLSAPFEQFETYGRANISSKQFLKENEFSLRQTTMGCSFSPERFMSLDKQSQTPKQKQERALEALKHITQDLGVKDVRFGIRWENCVDKDGNFDFSFYKPFLDYCLKNDISICLNIGPIKTFGWDENHTPKSVLRKLANVPPDNSVIGPETGLAKAGLEYLDKLLLFLKEEYTPAELENIKAFQPENEPFFPFGEYKWTSSTEYLEELISKIHFHFPEKQILVNSSGAFDLSKISNLFNRLIQKDGISPEKLTLGIDYYHMIEDVSKKLERISGILENKLGWIDFITASRVLPWFFGDLNLIKKMSQKGVKIEITEAQVEAWGRHTKPGNSLHDLQFVLLRCIELLKPALETQDKSVIRIWGIEKLAYLYMTGQLTQEQTGILKLAMAINDLTEAA